MDQNTVPVQPLNYQTAQATAPMYQQPVYPTATSLLGLDVSDTKFWKGALVGAAITLLLTNESVQKGVVKSVSRLTAAAQSGIEEMKEKFEDARAEAEAEAVGKSAAE
ncbi:MAG: hypothetical protein CSA34_01685 [Desulfobulbus propionicus]|nr:MAG: hypothetical protein CSA34_01685 [Desulfobulbus propionicus]